MIHNPSEEKRKEVIRSLILFTSFMGFSTWALGFVEGLALAPEFFTISFASGSFHLAAYLIIRNPSDKHAVFLSMVNISLMGLVIHYSGGITSPFMFILFCILVASLAHGLKQWINILGCVVVYLIVIGGELLGIFQTIPFSNFQIYQSPLTSVIIILSTVGFMGITSILYNVILSRLKVTIESEQKIKEGVLKKLSRLEAPSQVGLLVHKIIHDVKGPLGAVSGFVKILEDEPRLTLDMRKDCLMMRTELARISNLMNRMNQYSHPGNINRESLNLGNLIKNVLAVVSFYPETGEIRFIKKIAENPPRLILANKEEIQQVLFNVLKNAIEALRKKKREKIIGIELGTLGDRITLNISDNGPGIPEFMKNKIFQEAYTSKKGGSGLGLLMAKEIIQSHGGTINIEGKNGTGTKVGLVFPVFRKKKEIFQKNKRELIQTVS